MSYVEWLRVRNCLRVLAICLGVFILVVLVLRVSYNKYITEDDVFISHAKMQPGTTVAHITLPDGTKRTTINDPKDKTLVVIDNHGINGRHVTITEPKSKAHEHQTRAVIGSVHINETRNGDMVTTTIDTNGSVPFIFYMAFADVVAFVIATLLAAPFARENDGHLEYALTKPVSRQTFSIGVIGVDLGAIVVTSIMTIVTLIICQAMFEIPTFDFSGVNVNAILMGIAAPFAWYALLTAATASMKRGYGAVLGFAWPVAILFTVFGAVSLGDSIVGQLIHNVCWLVSRIIPLSYISFAVNENSAGELTGPANFGLRLSIEIALFLIYSALAVFQWRRVEA
jgi:hypothetical protein